MNNALRLMPLLLWPAAAVAAINAVEYIASLLIQWALT